MRRVLLCVVELVVVVIHTGAPLAYTFGAHWEGVAAWYAYIAAGVSVLLQRRLVVVFMRGRLDRTSGAEYDEAFHQWSNKNP